MNTKSNWKRIFACGLVALGVGCKKSATEQQPSTAEELAAQVGSQTDPSAADVATPPVSNDWYRVTLQFQGEHRPSFLMQLPGPEAKGQAKIANGAEEIDVHHEWEADEVTVEPRTDPYPSELVIARTDKPELMEGDWARFNPMFGDLDIPLTATAIGARDPHLRYAPAATEAEPVDFAGTWKVDLKIRGNAVAEFAQDGDVVTGYIRPHHFGDSQHLAGNVRDGKLLLSSFDGRSGATSMIASIDKKGQLVGSLRIADRFEEAFSAEKSDGFAVADELSLKKRHKTFPLKQLDAAPYKGKPTVVFLFATWCPVCAEVNKHLVDLYGEYHAQGLEVLALAIDLSEDMKANQAKVDEYVKASSIPWQVIPVSSTPQTFAKVHPIPQINGFEGLPATAFLNADHTVHLMVGGFDGTSTGPRHEKAKKRFRDAVAAIVKAP